MYNMTYLFPWHDQYINLVLSNCLQCLLYTSWMEERKVTLDDGRKLDLSSCESTIKLFWAVWDRGEVCIPGLTMDSLVLPSSRLHKQTVRFILHSLITARTFQPQLRDGVALIHIILMVGHIYNREDLSVDMFDLYLRKYRDQVDWVCPWTHRSSLDVALQLGLEIQAEQLYQLGCRANKEKEAELRMTERQVIKPRIPSIDHDNVEKRRRERQRLDETLSIWMNSEEQFRTQMKNSVMFSNKEDLSTEARVISSLTEWLERMLITKAGYPSVLLKLSGSVSEGTKMLPLDEIDFILQVFLETDLLVTDKYCLDYWMISEGCNTVHREFTKVIGKQPFPYIAKVILKKSYSQLGAEGSELKPEIFGHYMEKMISDALQEKELPIEVRVPEGKNLLEYTGRFTVEAPGMLRRTKSGVLMNLEYRVEDRWQKLSVDLVSVLVLDIDQRKKLLRMMPGFCRKKKKFLSNNGLTSDSDGIIVKNDNFRLSFSEGEKIIVCCDRELYLALKYLNLCSGKSPAIPTYLLKEIFCSFMTSSYIGPRWETLSRRMARLVLYAETSVISSPFYCSRLGSQLDTDCRHIFQRFRSKFQREFDDIEKERNHANRSCLLNPSFEQFIMYWPM